MQIGENPDAAFLPFPATSLSCTTLRPCSASSLRFSHTTATVPASILTNLVVRRHLIVDLFLIDRWPFILIPFDVALLIKESQLIGDRDDL